jgi:ribosomal protein L22
MTQPLSFKEQWQAKKILKRAKKKARDKAMVDYGMSKKQASGAVKKALNRIVNSKDTNKSVGRGI